MRAFLIFSLIFIPCCCFAFNRHRVLQTGEVAYRVIKNSDDFLSYEVTDGTFFMEASTSLSTGDLVSCNVHHNGKKSSKVVKCADVVYETVGEDAIKKMVEECKDFGRSRRATVADDHDTFNHDIVVGKPFKGDFKTGQPFGPGSHFAIFPGTKWCGFQNVASSMQDLGEHNNTDACCRTHDHCPYYIDRFETKYHYYNAYPWTISHCDCDQHLYSCLKRVNNPTSNEVGNLFFGMLDVQCFTFKNGEYCSNENSILSKLFCTGKNKGQMAVTEKFAHKWSDSDSEEDTEVVG